MQTRTHIHVERKFYDLLDFPAWKAVKVARACFNIAGARRVGYVSTDTRPWAWKQGVPPCFIEVLTIADNVPAEYQHCLREPCHG